MASAKDAARRMIALLDLTDLDPASDEAAIRRLCAKAKTPYGPVAAVCLFPRFVALAKSELVGSGIKVATVANFPAGSSSIAATVAETTEAIAAGADEIDVVMPYEAFLAGDTAIASDLIRQTRNACRRPDGTRALLKVILETGVLKDPAMIRAASDLAIEAGADFIKTSTGKREPGATLEATAPMIDAIVAARQRRLWIGFKAAGGIRTPAEAEAYTDLAMRKLGAEYVGPATFRIGASRLLDALIDVLGRPAGR